MATRRQMSRPGVGTIVLVLDYDCKFVMCRRSGSHGAGTWSAPGGWMEVNESFEDTVRREVCEEIGVVITEPQLVAVSNDVFADDGAHSVTLWHAAQLWSGTPSIMEPNKCTDIGWFTFDSLPSPLFLPWTTVDMHELRRNTENYWASGTGYGDGDGDGDGDRVRQLVIGGDDLWNNVSAKLRSHGWGPVRLPNVDAGNGDGIETYVLHPTPEHFRILDRQRN